MASKAAEKKAAADAAAPMELQKLGLENFVVETIHRNSLKGAPYNPRYIGDAEKRKLRAGLKKHGMVTPVTWNKRTGNIVGGHQRINQLDALAGTENYTLNAAVIDVSEEQEKELNILLNNTETQGVFDLEKLGALLKDPKIDIAGAGYDHADLYRIFGDSVISGSNGEGNDPRFDELAAKLDGFRETFKKIDAGRGGDEHYFVVVCRNGDEASDLLLRLGLPDNRYQSGESLEAAIKRAGAVGSKLPAGNSTDPLAPDTE